jgi:hypothetical protein
MVPVKKQKKYYQIAFALIPLLFSVAFVFYQSVLLTVLMIISSFVIVGTVPIFKKTQNIWMFLIVSVTVIPVNSYMICAIFSLGSLEDYNLFNKILYGAMLYCVFFSVEEILFGVITRLIWRNQYKINL